VRPPFSLAKRLDKLRLTISLCSSCGSRSRRRSQRRSLRSSPASPSASASLPRSRSCRPDALSRSHSVTLTVTTNVSYAFSNLLPGLYACSLLWVLNSAHRLADEINLAQLNSIQLVWHLGPSSSSHLPASAAGPSSADAAALGPSDLEQRRTVPLALAQVVHGTGPGTWELKRGLASAKARQRLGEDEIHVMSIRRRPSGVVLAGAGGGGEPQMAGPPPSSRRGRGSIVSLFGGSAGSACGSGAGASGSEAPRPGLQHGRGSIASLWTTTSTAKTGLGTDEAV